MRRVRIVEVGPRDGLQNEKAIVPLEAKRAFLRDLAASGLPDIEVGAFVRPDRVPQMADTEALCAGLPAGPTWWGLVPNLKGAERAAKAGLKAVAVFTAASETFNARNIQMSITESLEAIRKVAGFAGREGLRTRAYVSTCFGCPYEGTVAPAKVAEVTQALLDLGIPEISVGDTIGVGVPAQVEEVFSLLLRGAPASAFAGHFHDTRGTALENVLAAMALGVSTFDASAGGLGGCPYAPGAPGNLATEALVDRLGSMGVETGVDPALLRKAAAGIQSSL